MRRRVKLLSLTLLGLAFLSVAQTKPAEEGAVAAIKRFKLVDLPAAYRLQDTISLRTMLADRYERIGFDGERTSKEEEIARAGRTRPTYDTLWFDIHRLDIFENGTAIVSGTGNVRGRDAEGPYSMTYASSNTLMSVGGRWLLLGSHVSGRTIQRPR